MDEQSGESDEEEVMGDGIGESEMEERRNKKGWFQSQGEAYRKEQSVIFREDDEGGRARITTDEKRILRGRYIEMRLGMYRGWLVGLL